MDIATIIGLLGGTALILSAVILGGSALMFVNIAGLLIVAGGTLASTFIKFTMADVYVGSLVDWGLSFGTIPPKEAFVAYAERIQQRPAYKDAKKIDNDLIERMKK